MPKKWLQGSLPSDHQTQVYLCEELGLPFGTIITLDLNEQLPTSGMSGAHGVSWTPSVRVACLLAIWGSDRRALTSDEILQALIKAIPFCHENRELAVIKSPGRKRRGWAVSFVLPLAEYHEADGFTGYRPQHPLEEYDLRSKDTRGSALQTLETGHTGVEQSSPAVHS